MHLHLTQLTTFAIVMALTILLPRLMERIKLPGVIGFILVGILTGPAVLGIVDKDGPVITLFAEIGKLTVASLSFPQMAATLASAVVGYQAMNAKGERLLDEGFVNAVVILVIVSCVAGPILTERFAPPLAEGGTGDLPEVPEPVKEPQPTV